MTLATDLKTLYHLSLAPKRGSTHAQRLDNFYRSQADQYDDFRRRLLHGREALFRSLPIERDSTWVDMGGGTGANLEFVGATVNKPRKVWLVDLAKSLLEQADRRISARGWSNVETVAADAATFDPHNVDSAAGCVDLVTFSYSLTMMPDWFAAIDNAWRMLRVGGTIGVVDFYVARKYPEPTRTRHSWWTRHFWPCWFGHDNVYLSADHLPYLTHRFEVVQCDERRARLPYLPLVRVPYYTFVGQKKAE